MRTSDTRFAVVFSASTVLAAVLLFFLAFDLTPQAHHMSLHVLLMNVGAPFLAAAMAGRLAGLRLPARWLWIATAAQLVVLWLAHLPAIHDAAMAHHSLRLAVYVALTASALAFWVACIAIAATSRWQTVPALAITGKLFCLLAALLVFSPRPLYAAHVQGALEDQQLAGLLMIIACPLSYLTAGLVISVQLIGTAPAPRLRRVDP
jgi:putative membrane protein